jgi:hypothetical protein
MLPCPLWRSELNHSVLATALICKKKPSGANRRIPRSVESGRCPEEEQARPQELAVVLFAPLAQMLADNSALLVEIDLDKFVPFFSSCVVRCGQHRWSF